MALVVMASAPDALGHRILGFPFIIVLSAVLFESAK